MREGDKKVNVYQEDDYYEGTQTEGLLFDMGGQGWPL